MKWPLVVLIFSICPILPCFGIEVIQSGDEISYLYSEEENEAVSVALDELIIRRDQMKELYVKLDEKDRLIMECRELNVHLGQKLTATQTMLVVSGIGNLVALVVVSLLVLM